MRTASPLHPRPAPTPHFTSRIVSPGGTNVSGYTHAPFDGRREEQLKVQCRVRDVPPGARVVLHTNLNPGKGFANIDMKPVGTEGPEQVFEANLSVRHVRAYRLAAHIANEAGVVRWLSEDGIGDTVIRPFAREHLDLNMEQIQVDQVGDGTFQGLIDAGPETYGLAHLEEAGINAIWLMPPFETKPWAHRHPHDDKGSPYAVTDPFTIKRQHSRDARKIVESGHDPDGELSRTAALKEFQRFVAAAKTRGIKVILDVVLNHLGHDADFRDRFTTADGRAEIRKDDFSQIAVNQEHLATIRRRLQNPAVANTLQALASEFFAAVRPDGSIEPTGAKRPEDIVSGGWGDWRDTSQLNHGARWGHGEPTSEAQRAVLDWLTRMLEFWAIDMDVAGFRFDNAAGLPAGFFETCLNNLQAKVDEAHPGKNLFYMAEDFCHVDRTRTFVDRIQGGFYTSLVQARTASQIRDVLDHPYHQEVLTGGIHDEERLAELLGGDVGAATRYLSLIQLFGGPCCRQMGDSYIERLRSQFRSWAKVPVLVQLQDRTLADANIHAHQTIARAGRARRDQPALKSDQRAWLQRMDGATDETLLAFARHADLDATDPAAEHSTVLVFANMEGESERESVFRLDGETQERIDPNKQYNVRNILSPRADKQLWAAARSGRSIIEEGVYAKLDPYEVQALVLEEVRGG
ncbi:MAG: hypothetical protein IPK13_09315 [Deltaproteobacteria bacterium]|nr:hypothetical protein [Deltaproteobacteria bacterium]